VLEVVFHRTRQRLAFAGAPQRDQVVDAHLVDASGRPAPACNRRRPAALF
jgi:hypothetical protein